MVRMRVSPSPNVALVPVSRRASRRVAVMGRGCRLVRRCKVRRPPTPLGLRSERMTRRGWLALALGRVGSRARARPLATAAAAARGRSGGKG